VRHPYTKSGDTAYYVVDKERPARVMSRMSRVAGAAGVPIAPGGGLVRRGATMSDEPVILLIQTVALIVATVLRVLLFILTLPFRVAAMIWAAIRRHRPKTRDNELLIEEGMARGLPKALAVPAVRRATAESDGSRHDRLWATKALDQALAEVLRDQYSPETRGQLRQEYRVTWAPDRWAIFVVAGQPGKRQFSYYLPSELAHGEMALSYSMIVDQAMGELQVALGEKPDLAYKWPRPDFMSPFDWTPPLPGRPESQAPAAR
jgi:hypothetical protein